MQVPNSFRDPFWSTLATDAENKYQLPKGILVSVLTNGERSNADQVSEAGARTPFQIIPSTRDAIKKKYGIDAYSSPEASAESAALLLRESLERNNGDAASAVAEYHGGTDRRNWGPRTRSYVDRVVGTGGGGSTQPAGRARWAPITSDSPESSLDQSFNMFFGPKPSPDGGKAYQQLLTGQRFDDSTPIPANLGEEFFSGVRSATEGMASDLEYFKALGNTLIGDDESAARNVAKARIREEFAAAELQGLETFEQFLDEPTVEGFLSLAARGSGQVLPSAALSIASAGTGAIAGIFGRAVLNQANRYVAKRIIKDSVERVGQGIADSTEKEIARIAYGTYRQAAKTGALAGAFGAEFAPMSGSNLGEAMDSGQPLDRANALRAAAVGVPQAAIGVGSEYALVKLLGEQATKRAAKEGGLFANFAKKVGSGLAKGAGIESPTEALQEGISVANRADLDPLFTAQDGWLRIGEAALIGAIGGGAVGGAGGVVGGTLDAASRLPNPSSVLQKAKGMIASGREQIINQQINSEQFGDIVPGVTNPESERDINAQLGAMFDDSTQKNAVWVAGTTPQFGAKPNQVGAKELGRGTGNVAYAAFVPGRGTIISTNRGVVDEVIKAGASDESLAAALGYSSSKDYSSPGDQVIQVLDNSGNVVSEEVANEQTAGAAMAKAQQMFGSSGKYRINVTTVEKALEERRKRFQEERKVDVNDIELPEDSDSVANDEFDPTRRETEGNVYVLSKEFDGVGSGLKTDPTKIYENEPETRAEYEKVFGPTDWSNPRYASMSRSLLKKAIEEQQANPDSEVTIEDLPRTQEQKAAGERAGFRIVARDLGSEERFIVKDLNGVERGRVPLGRFLAWAVKRANALVARPTRQERLSPDFADIRRQRERVTVATPDGEVQVVVLSDLVNSGRGLLLGRGRSALSTYDSEGRPSRDEFGAAQAGLLEMIGDLLDNGYDLRIDGESITKASNNGRLRPEAGEIIAWNWRGRSVTLAELLAPRDTMESSNELAIYAPSETGGVEVGTGVEFKSRIDPSSGQLNVGSNVRTMSSSRTREVSAAEQAYFNTTPYRVIQGTDSFLRQQKEAYEKRGFVAVLREKKKAEFDPTESERTGVVEPGEQTLANEMGEVNPFSSDFVDARTAPTNLGPRDGGSALGPRDKERISRNIGKMARDVITDLLDVLKLKDPPRIYTLDELQRLNRQQLEALFPRGLATITLAIRQMQEKPSILGRHLNAPGMFGKVIIFRESGNALQDALVVAHEIGHSLFKEERDRALSNKALRTRLIQAYKNSKVYEAYNKQYGFDKGFEEWFSDQVSQWASRRYNKKQRQSLVGKFFADFVARLEGLVRALNNSLRKRMNAAREQYVQVEPLIQEVLRLRREEVNENGLSFTEKMFSYEVDEMALQANAPQISQNMVNAGQRFFNHPMWKHPYVRPLMKIVRTADGVLRLYGGNRIADFFYVRAQELGSDGKLGFIGQRTLRTNEFHTKFEREVGKLDEPDMQQAFIDAASDTPTAQLTGKPKAIREFLEAFHRDYIAPSKTKIGFRENYFPVSLLLQDIADRQNEFVDIFLDPANYINGRQTISRATAEKAAIGLRNIQQAILNEPDLEANILDPSQRAVEAIRLTANIRREVLAERGFLNSPDVAFFEYLRHAVKRVEFDRQVLDDSGNNLLEAELNRLNPEDKAQAEEIIEMYLGYRSSHMSPMWRKLSSWAQFAQFILLLPFATLGSLTDIAGPVIASKEFGSVTTGLKEIVSTFRSRDEALRFAKVLGVVSAETTANTYVASSELDYMDPKARVATDWFFKNIGLTWFTNFSRAFAANMGVQFIITHAQNEFNNPRSERYLTELGLTREEVLAWMNNGRELTSPEGLKVKQALQRFVESSTLRPNAAERPVWASDPMWAVVWQLKGYFYSVGKVWLGGIKREATVRGLYDPGSPGQKLTQMGLMLALPLVATLPLAMLGMELREYAKFGLAWLLPGVDADQRFFKTDRMDWSEYLAASFERSGLHGPLALIGSMNQSAEWGNSALFTALGPTAEMAYNAFDNGFRVNRTFKDITPAYNLVL